MPTRDQIRGLVEQGEDYPTIGEAFDIPPGQAYLIGTGSVADGSSATRPPDAILGTRAQALINPREMAAPLRSDVHAWVRRLAYSDAAMRPSAGSTHPLGGRS